MTEELPQRPPSRFHKRALQWLCGILGTGFLVANGLLQLPAVQGPLHRQLAAIFGSEVEWTLLWWNPFAGFTVENLRIAGPSSNGIASGVKIHRLMARPEYLPLFSKHFRLHALRVESPELVAVRAADGRCLFPGCAPAAVPPAAPPQAGATAPEALVSLLQDQPVCLPVVPPALASAAPQPAPGAAPAAPVIQEATKPATGPTPDMSFLILNASFTAIDAGSGRILATVAGAGLRLDQAGGEMGAASIGVQAGGNWQRLSFAAPIRWQGPVAEALLAERQENGASLRVGLKMGMVQGFPLAFEASARRTPVSWFPALAVLLGNGFPSEGEVSGDLQAGVMLLRPSERVAGLVMEASDVGLPFRQELLADLGQTGAWPGNPDPKANGGPLVINHFQIQARWRNNQGVVPMLQLDAGGAVAAAQFAIGPGFALNGEARVLLGAEGEERVRRLEQRLPRARHLGFDGTTEVRFPNGSSARLKARQFKLGGTLGSPSTDLWPDLGMLGIADTLAMLRASQLPVDPDAVDLIPLPK